MAFVAQAYVAGKVKAAAKGKILTDATKGRGAPKDAPPTPAKPDDKSKGDGRTFLTPTLQQAAANFGAKIERLPVESLLVLRSTISLFVSAVSYVSLFVVVVLLTFTVHQLFLWVDEDPEKAFDQAATLLEVLEIVWDAYAVLSNSVIDISNAALIPLWNTGTYYVIEPVVVLVLEVFSLVFMGHDFDGVVNEADFPYAGLDCTSTAEAAAWCGRYAFYEAKLLNEQADYRNDSLVFGTATARRLSELADDGTFVTPTFELTNVTDALDELTTLGITLGAPLADVGMSVADEVFTKSAKVIFDMVFFLLRNLFEVLRWLVKSGLLTTLVTIGIDYFISTPSRFNPCNIRVVPPPDTIQNPVRRSLLPLLATSHAPCGHGLGQLHRRSLRPGGLARSIALQCAPPFPTFPVPIPNYYTCTRRFPFPRIASSLAARYSMDGSLPAHSTGKQSVCHYPPYTHTHFL
jgi:hypothetical protein